MIKHEIKSFDVKSISLKFKCQKCNEEFIENVTIPTLEINNDKEIDNSEFYNCPDCKKDFEIKIVASNAGRFLYIDVEDSELTDFDEDNSEYKIILEEREEQEDYYYSQYIDAILKEQDPFETFERGISEIVQLYELSYTKPNLKRIILMQSYSGLITQLEKYLQNTLVINILNKDDFFKAFVEEFEDFKKEKFILSEIYKKQNELEDRVKKILSELIYHNLHRIMPIYKSVFKIYFPLIGDIMKIVNLRHDIVHRGGRDKDGGLIEINHDKFIDAKEEILHFVKRLNSEIRKMNELDKEVFVEDDLPF